MSNNTCALLASHMRNRPFAARLVKHNAKDCNKNGMAGRRITGELPVLSRLQPVRSYYRFDPENDTIKGSI